MVSYIFTLLAEGKMITCRKCTLLNRHCVTPETAQGGTTRNTDVVCCVRLQVNQPNFLLGGGSLADLVRFPLKDQKYHLRQHRQ